ncbi:hypothetical protein Tco_1073342, partial [Tanacetum coccineum]
MENAPADSNPTETNTNDDMNIKLSKEFLMELKSNAYHEMFDEDVVDHIAKVLEILDLISIPRVYSHQLRMKVFPLSLADDARQWWINEGEGKITTWEELVENFFCKFYPESHDGEDEMLDEGDNWGIDPLEFISRVNSSFENHMKVDGRTRKESDYGNPLNTATDSFFKAHDEHDIEEGNKLRLMKRKEDNKNDGQPNKRDLAGKEIDEVGEVLIIWNPVYVVVML